MKKFMKNNLEIFITIIITTIVVGSIGVYADYKYSSNEVSYKDGSVKEAIDELYEKAELKPYDLAGIPIYYDPVNNVVCNDYVAANSLNETKTGCLKWYIISGDRENITMILDHNTTYGKAWNTDNKNVSYEESDIKADIDALKTESGWEIQPRLITAQEVANITGYTSWVNPSRWYCLGTKKQDNVAVPFCNAVANKPYAWLFDYTMDCTSSGCDFADSSVAGYWTSTPFGAAGSDNRVWTVRSGGYLDGNGASSGYGIRPVITISKSILK